MAVGSVSYNDFEPPPPLEPTQETEPPSELTTDNRQLTTALPRPVDTLSLLERESNWTHAALAFLRNKEESHAAATVERDRAMPA
jgi:hypothetical protein